MLLGPLSAAFGVMANPIPRGCIELPTAYGEHVWGLMKGRPTKYIKRVPKPGGGYRYFYDAGHGGGVHAHEHMVEGAKFAHGEGHFHIVKQDGDKLHVRNTATGEEHTITKQALAQKLAEHHAEGLKAYRDRATKALAEAKANKASPKQIARLEERVKRAGGTVKPETKHEDAVLSEVPEYQRRAYKSDTASELRAKAASVRDMAKRAQERNQGGPAFSIDSDRQSRLDAEKRRHAAEAAEYEANATFLERLADAKDKDAGKEAAPKETPKPAPESKPSAKPPTRVDRSYEAQRKASAPKAEGKQKPAAGTGESSNPKERGVFKLPDGIVGSIEIFDDGLDEDFDEPETIANMKLLQANMKRDKLDVSALSPDDIFKVSQVLSEIGEWEEGNESDKSSAASKQTIKAINKLSGDLANVAAAKRMTTSLPIGSKVILGGVKSHQWEVVGHEPKDGKIRVRRVGSSDTSGPGTLVNATMAERL